MATLTNSFHNTEFRTTLLPWQIDRRRESLTAHAFGGGLATPAEVAWGRKVRRALCGVGGCQCATSVLGER